MNLEKSVDHGEHSEHSGRTIKCDVFWIHPLGWRKNAEKLGWHIYIPKFEYTTDNAAMIAMVAQLKLERNECADLSVGASARYDMEEVFKNKEE